MFEDNLKGPGGHIPDGTGPPEHGRGQGPGKGLKNKEIYKQISDDERNRLESIIKITEYKERKKRLTRPEILENEEKILKRLEDSLVTYDIVSDDLLIHVKAHHDTSSRIIKDLKDSPIFNSIHSLYSENIFSIQICNPKKQHANVINTIDRVVGYNESSVLGLEHNEKLNFRQKAYDYINSFVHEMHPRNLFRLAVKHGVFGILFGAAIYIDHAYIPYKAWMDKHPEYLFVTAFHIPESIVLGAYIAKNKITSIIKKKKNRYGKNLDIKLNKYLDAVETSEDKVCESIGAKMERDIQIDMFLGGKRDMQNMNIMVSHLVDYMQSGDKNDLSMVRIMSKRLKKRLKNDYNDWMAYVSAIAIEHMAEFDEDEFGAKELIRYKVFRDYLLNIPHPDFTLDFKKGTAQRLNAHHNNEKTHNPDCPFYAMARGELK